jgi:D-alanyl-D-alanine carboxypeptidase
MNLICLVYGEKPSSDTDRWKISKDLFEYGFANYKTIDIASLLTGVPALQAQVQNYAANDSGDGLLEFKQPETGTTYVTLETNIAQGLLDVTDSLEAVPAYNTDPLSAPIYKDDMLGTVTYKSKATGVQVYTCDLIASRDVFEEGSQGETAVTTLPPTPTNKYEDLAENGGVWWWLLIPAALIVFLVVRILKTKKSKHRFKRKHRPHYSYRIK